jgi:hypothetical protein
MGKAVGLVLVVVILGVVAYFAFPGFKAEVNKRVDKAAGWTEEARRQDPVGFIEFSERKLQENIDKFESARATLVTARSKLEDIKRENQQKLAFAEKQAGEFKLAYQKTSAGQSWPVQVAGRAYSEGDLKSQVGMILKEKTGFESIVKQVEAALAKSETKHSDLVTRISESKGKLGLLGAQKAIVKVSKLTADTERLMADVQDVLIQNEALEAKTTVRTVDELMKDAMESTPSQASPAVDAFLNS